MNKLWFSLASLVFALANAGPAHAFDYKIHPGSFCQPASGSQTASFIRGSGFIYHTNVGQLLQVTCPILRDRVPHWGQPSEKTRIDAGVHFDLGFTPTPPVACRFVSLAENGSEVPNLPAAQSTTPNGPNIQALFFDVRPEQTAIDGTYSINCTLPAYAFLLRYVVGEDKATDDGGF